MRSIDSRVGIVMLDSPAQQATNIRSIFRKAARRRLSDDRSDRIWTVSMVIAMQLILDRLLTSPMAALRSSSPRLSELFPFSLCILSFLGVLELIMPSSPSRPSLLSSRTCDLECRFECSSRSESSSTTDPSLDMDEPCARLDLGVAGVDVCVVVL